MANLLKANTKNKMHFDRGNFTKFYKHFIEKRVNNYDTSTMRIEMIGPLVKTKVMLVKKILMFRKYYFIKYITLFNVK